MSSSSSSPSEKAIYFCGVDGSLSCTKIVVIKKSPPKNDEDEKKEQEPKKEEEKPVEKAQEEKKPVQKPQDDKKEQKPVEKKEQEPKNEKESVEKTQDGKKKEEIPDYRHWKVVKGTNLEFIEPSKNVTIIKEGINALMQEVTRKDETDTTPWKERAEIHKIVVVFPQNKDKKMLQFEEELQKEMEGITCEVWPEVDVIAKTHFKNDEKGVALHSGFESFCRVHEETTDKLYSVRSTPELDSAGGAFWIARTALQMVIAEIEKCEVKEFQRTGFIEELFKEHIFEGKVDTIYEMNEKLFDLYSKHRLAKITEILAEFPYKKESEYRKLFSKRAAAVYDAITKRQKDTATKIDDQDCLDEQFLCEFQEFMETEMEQHKEACKREFVQCDVINELFCHAGEHLGNLVARTLRGLKSEKDEEESQRLLDEKKRIQEEEKKRSSNSESTNSESTEASSRVSTPPGDKEMSSSVSSEGSEAPEAEKPATMDNETSSKKEEFKAPHPPKTNSKSKKGIQDEKKRNSEPTNSESTEGSSRVSTPPGDKEVASEASDAEKSSPIDKETSSVASEASETSEAKKAPAGSSVAEEEAKKPKPNPNLTKIVLSGRVFDSLPLLENGFLHGLAKFKHHKEVALYSVREESAVAAAVHAAHGVEEIVFDEPELYTVVSLAESKPLQLVSVAAKKEDLDARLAELRAAAAQ